MVDRSATDLAPLAAKIASAAASFERVEQGLASGALDEAAAALELVTEAAAELRYAYEFIDSLEESVNSAGLLVEATERRLDQRLAAVQEDVKLAALRPEDGVKVHRPLCHRRFLVADADGRAELRLAGHAHLLPVLFQHRPHAHRHAQVVRYRHETRWSGRGSRQEWPLPAARALSRGRAAR